MQISTPTASVAAVDPSQPPLPGTESDVIARTRRTPENTYVGEVRIRTDKPVGAPLFTAFDDAVDAARDIMVVDRKAARWGVFKRNPGRVESIALMQVTDGIKLVRSNVAVDRYKEPVPGQMFPGQNRWVSGPGYTVRETPATLALVGADMIVDLRSGGLARCVELPKRR